MRGAVGIEAVDRTVAAVVRGVAAELDTGARGVGVTVEVLAVDVAVAVVVEAVAAESRLVGDG